MRTKKAAGGRKDNARTLMRAEQCILSNLRNISADCHPEKKAHRGLGQSFWNLQRAFATPEVV